MSCYEYVLPAEYRKFLSILGSLAPVDDPDTYKELPAYLHEGVDDSIRFNIFMKPPPRGYVASLNYVMICYDSCLSPYYDLYPSEGLDQKTEE